MTDEELNMLATTAILGGPPEGGLNATENIADAMLLVEKILDDAKEAVPRFDIQCEYYSERHRYWLVSWEFFADKDKYHDVEPRFQKRTSLAKAVTLACLRAVGAIR